MRKKPGHFISFEGGDGAGKSTQVKTLANALKKRGITVVVTREPGGSPGAEDIRTLLVNGKPGRWDPLSETLLLFAARHDHIEQTIKPALSEGKWVICDRFTDSTYAYQGAGGGLNRETIRRIESVSIGDFKPELTLLLDVPVEVGLGRTQSRGGKEDRYENFKTDFHENLRQGYLELSKRGRERYAVIDAAAEQKIVAEAVWQAVADKFRLK